MQKQKEDTDIDVSADLKPELVAAGWSVKENNKHVKLFYKGQFITQWTAKECTCYMVRNMAEMLHKDENKAWLNSFLRRSTE